MSTSLTNCAMPRARFQDARKVIRFGMGSGAVAMLLLAGGTPEAIAQEPNRVYAGCVLNSNRGGGPPIDTLAGLAGDITAGAQNPIDAADIAYVVVYAIDNDNNGQALSTQQGPTGEFTGPVICVAPGVQIETAEQTDDIPDIDILDVQDALILRHAATGTTTPGRNRICHTTDGFTDCFDIE